MHLWTVDLLAPPNALTQSGKKLGLVQGTESIENTDYFSEVRQFALKFCL